MTDPSQSRWIRLVRAYPELTGGGVAALGVVAIWQDIGPAWLGMALLLGGIGLYVVVTEVLGDDTAKSNPEPDPLTEDEAQDLVDAGLPQPDSRDPENWDIPEDEAPWWDIGAHETTQERIEAMKRQDPDYDETDDENILDKFARVLGLDEDAPRQSEASKRRTAESEADHERGDERLLDELDPLFEDEGSLEVGDLEADLDER